MRNKRNVCTALVFSIRTLFNALFMLSVCEFVQPVSVGN